MRRPNRSLVGSSVLCFRGLVLHLSILLRQPPKPSRTKTCLQRRQPRLPTNNRKQQTAPARCPIHRLVLANKLRSEHRVQRRHKKVRPSRRSRLTPAPRRRSCACRHVVGKSMRITHIRIHICIHIRIHIRIPGSNALRGVCGREVFVPWFRTRVCIRTQTRVRNPCTKVYRGAWGCNELYMHPHTRPWYQRIAWCVRL